MRSRFFSKILVVVLAFITLLTAGGVYATWTYGLEDVEEKQTDVNVGVQQFYYAPEEVLPGDDQATEIGENHLELIEKILNEVSYGLNATKKPIIHDLLNEQGDVVYCQQNVQGGNLKHLLIDGTGAHALLFQIEYVDEDTYITYTYTHGDVVTAAVGNRVYAYRTVMARGQNGVWTALNSVHGSAIVISATSSLRGLDSSTWEKEQIKANG